MRIETVPALVDRAAALSHGDAIVMPDERTATTSSPATARWRSPPPARRRRAPGDRVGLMSASVEYLVALLGAMRAARPGAHERALQGPRAGATSSTTRGMRLLSSTRVRALAEHRRCRRRQCRVVVGRATPASRRRRRDDPARRRATAPRRRRPDDDALILYTSGTTANPKGCVYTTARWSPQGDRYAERLGSTPDDRFWTPLPFFHVSGIARPRAAARRALRDRPVGRCFEPDSALDQLERERCTVAFPAFETIWLAVLNHPRFAEADLSALRLVVNVGVPSVAPEDAGAAAAGRADLVASAAPRRAASRASATPTTRSSSASRRAGAPLRGRRAPHRRPGDGRRRCAPGEIGEILMRGPTRFVRYHEDPEQTARAIDAEGWFHSGDLGRIDEEGRVSFVGRLKDMLKVGGENVAAAEIETLPAHASGGRDRPGRRRARRALRRGAGGVRPARAGREATEQELIEFCLGQIATFKVPRYVRFVERVADVGDEDPEVPAPRARSPRSSRRPASPRRRRSRAAEDQLGAERGGGRSTIFPKSSPDFHQPEALDSVLERDDPVRSAGESPVARRSVRADRAPSRVPSVVPTTRSFVMKIR